LQEVGGSDEHNQLMFADYWKIARVITESCGSDARMKKAAYPSA
jgi:hypothetical protein